ncbi:APC family permease [Mycobacterium sp. THU-M104]|uniref:APC family permease n=1 Tax=Mycobacterium sp. THU-M104 TaxID=3410515 RepID=UPI003B9A21C6
MDRADTAGESHLHRVMGPGVLLLFIVGDMLGTGIYALIGDVGAEVGGAAWVPFLLAFVIATVTACSYLELVTKYPRAAGTALYVHKAFGNRFVTFMVAFLVMCVGISGAATASRFFGSNFIVAFKLFWGTKGVVVVAMLFMVALAVVNLRGMRESAKLNVVLTLIEITGLVMVIAVGLWASVKGGHAHYSRVIAFNVGDKNLFVALTAATSLAFFAMAGFEDSVNMAEETKDPVRTFPKVLLSGLVIAAVIYTLVAVVSVAVVPVKALEASDTPLVDVVEAAAPGLPTKIILPFISMVAVSNTALLGMLMASRLIYGMAREGVLPSFLGAVSSTRRSPWVAVLFTTAIALGLILYVTAFANRDAISVLSGTTSLLLLAVFTMVNVAVLVLRRDASTVGRPHFRTPTPLPIFGFLSSVLLLMPFFGRPVQQYVLAAIMISSGVVIAVIGRLVSRGWAKRRTDAEPAPALSDTR